MTTFTTEDRIEAFRSIEGDDEIQAAATQKPKSFWNHRVVRSINKYGEVWFEVAEVYYNKEGKPCGYCNSYVGGENMEELAEQMERHKKATTLPILNADTDFNNKWDEDHAKEF